MVEKSNYYNRICLALHDHKNTHTLKPTHTHTHTHTHTLYTLIIKEVQVVLKYNTTSYNA